MVSYGILKILSALACLMPRGMAEACGRALGALAWPLVPAKRKKLSHDQIVRCLGVDDAEAERISRAAAVRFGPMIMEVLRFPVIKKHIDEYITFVGLDKLRQGLAAGKGCIIAAAHSGNWELTGGAFAQAGIPLVGVAQKQKSLGANRWIFEQRELIGMHITDKTGVREMFRMLKEGWAIGLIMDQDSSIRDGVVVDFFGQPTRAAVGAASMARFDGVPIFTAFMHRDEHGHHTLVVDGPYYVEKTKDKKADIKRTTQLLTTAIEKHIRLYPEEWFWLHDRWKSMREEAAHHHE